MKIISRCLVLSWKWVWLRCARHFGYCIRSPIVWKSDGEILKKKKQQLQLTSSWAKAQYSASDEDFATIGCFLDFQQTSDRVSQKETITSHRMISIETSTPICVTKIRELYYTWHEKLRKVLSLGFPFKYQSMLRLLDNDSLLGGLKID